MYIKNRRNSNKFKGFGSYQTSYLNEILVLRNRLLFNTNRYQILKEPFIQLLMAI